jgi:hypothetical protein
VFEFGITSHIPLLITVRVREQSHLGETRTALMMKSKIGEWRKIMA